MFPLASIVPLTVLPKSPIHESVVSHSTHKSTKSYQQYTFYADSFEVSSLQALTVSHVSPNDLSQMELGSIHDARLSPQWTNVVREEL